MSKMGNATKKVLAAILTMLLVFGMVPVSAVPAAAATTDYPDAVTVTVKDSEGNAVSGAQVAFIITDDADVEIKNDTVTTNVNGTAVVLDKADYKNNLKITGTVTKEDYETADFNSAITSEDADISVELNTNKITDITVTGVSREVIVNDALELVAGDAVIISGLKADDKVSYQINGENSTTMPKISKVGTYNVAVVVERTGYELFTATVTSKITEKVVTVDATASSGLTYNGKEQALVKINNADELKDKYGVTLSVENEKATDAGTYAVKITGTSSVEGVVVEEKTFDVKINPVQINNDLAIIKTYNEKYDGKEHPAVTVELKDGIKATVTYSVDGSDWTAECPKVKAVGETIVKIKIVPDDSKNYKGEVFARKAIVSKSSDRELKFSIDAFNATAESKSNAEVVTKDGETITINKSYSFGAKAAEQEKTETIKYTVEVIGEGKATIDEKGLLTVTEPGTFKVTAIIDENSNYEIEDISHIINVRAVPKDKDGNRVAFVDFGETEEVNYFVNKNKMVLSNVVAKSTVKASDNSNITYKVLPVDNQKAYGGIACDATTGKVYISDIDAFIAALNRSSGLLKVKVVATKSEGAITIGDTDSYIINIRYPKGPENPITLAMSLTGTGWINSEVTVTPAAGYTIAKAKNYGSDATIIEHETINNDSVLTEVLGNAFGATVKFGDDGQNKRSVYLCDAEGYIYEPVAVKVNMNGVMQDLKIDRHNPDASAMKITYSTEEDSIESVIKTLFFKDTVTFTLEATDKLSGIQKIVCEYDGKEVPIESFETFNDGKSARATATITIKEGEAYKNKVSFKAYDRAGNMTKKTGEEIVIIDYISPELTVEYVNTSNEVSGRHYFNEAAPLVFKARVKETNGFKENGIVRVFKDGKAFDDVFIKHENINDEDVYTVTIPTEKAKEGVYQVELSYEDKSTNKMVGPGVNDGVFVSDEMVIDVTDPKVSFKYKENNKHNNAKDSCEDYTVKLTVTELNFDATGFKATVDAEDINENPVMVAQLNEYIQNAANWKSLGDNKYECVLTYGAGGILPDAIYNNIAFEYTDIAANTVSKDSKKFVIDTTAPTAPKIGYQTPLAEVIANVATFGMAEDTVREVLYKYFNLPTKITISSTDDTSGLEKFVLEYNSEDSECKSHKDYIIIDNIKPVQDKNSKHIYEATVVLPESLSMADFDQLRGSLTAYSVDNHGIKSETVTDEGTVVVVDNIAPEVSVEYDASNVPAVGNKTYYNGAINATITVEEANFYSEDVKLVVERNGVDIGFKPTDITWENAVDENEKVIPDTYKGKFTLPAPEDHSADGDYVVKVTYTDKSTNEAAAYESDILVIDTTTPVISVAYSEDFGNANPFSEDDHTRYYFGKKADVNAVQVATITITEHNFNEAASTPVIIAKNIDGEEVTGTYEETEWTATADPDVFEKKITYKGDANYTFDISCKDLADNGADYGKTDYFTVDNTEPVIVESKQTNRVANTILKNITFGYFGEKAKIEVTAEDDTSPVNVIEYSYTKTDGTSAVNKEAETGSVGAEKISYSETGRKATFTFTMPKGAINQNNMHGTVKFVATDRAGNKSNGETDGADITGVIVDSIAPGVTIAYNKAYKTEKGISYYDGNITGTITLKEANFDNRKTFKLWYIKDGVRVDVENLKWVATKNADQYVATFTLTEDGDYIVHATYNDRAKNNAEFKKATGKGTEYPYVSNQLTIDTKINAPVITFNGVASNGGSFSGDLTAAFKFEDDNYDSYQVTLTRTRYAEKDVDVKDDFIENVRINENGGSCDFEILKDRANDGVYTLTVKMTDKVDHSSTTTATFVVNRFGSVYVYNDALINLINGYVQDVEEDLVITEYNPNKLKDGSISILIKKDGISVSDATVSTSPAKNNGWYEYVHTIDKDTFELEGKYTIDIASKDEAGSEGSDNNKENVMNSKFELTEDVICFRVDKTTPTLDNVFCSPDGEIKGDKPNRYTEIKDVKGTITWVFSDAIGIEKIELICLDGNGNKIEGMGGEVYKHKEGDAYITEYTYTLDFNESNLIYDVKFIVTDASGRVLDTSDAELDDKISEDFTSGILVSTNFFVRFWHDKPLFWGVVGGTLGAAALIIILIALKKRKNKDKK